MVFFLTDWALLLFVITISCFLFLDEEPFFDPTDWNIVHILLFLICLLVVAWDNIIRARFGQFSYKDQVLLFSTFSFWFSMENYFRAIVVIFCFHCLTPLELELIELLEVYQNCLVWYTADILPAIIVLVLCLWLTCLINFAMAGIARTLLHFVTLLLLLLLFIFLISLWDFLATSLSGCLFHRDALSYYNVGRSTLGYDMILSGEDAYDWHSSSASSFIFRFEDLYFFFLQLFNLVALYSCIVVWAFLLLDLLILKDNSGDSYSGGAFLFGGVCYRWLDHALWCFFYSYGAILFVGLRIFLRITYDFN